jgi:hypothetical protein
MLFKKKEPEYTGRRPAAGGRQNAQVFSYYANRSRTDTARGRNEVPTTRSIKRQSLLANLPSILATIVIVLALLYTTTLSTSPKIVIRATNTASTRATSEYQAYAAQLLQASVFNLSKLTINTDGVALQMQRRFPEFQQVSVTVPVLGRQPVITAIPTEPTFVVRDGTSQAFYVSNDGRVIMKAANAASLPVVLDQSGFGIELGKQVLTKDNVAFLSEVIRQLKAKDVSIADMTLPPVANELHVRIDGKPYYIKFNMTGDARQQAGTFLAVKQELEGDKVTPKEYIDVRVDERAYYK